ncbi:hypothetical protein B0H10DRAFT_552654 [Mycena sp. CBHHK59/15]|nr:hypothetical protein B0H10DRAFT_552654 [Mycena sp. CBHHK59/15]
MGFKSLKRFFSIGSKRNKKKRGPAAAATAHLHPIPELAVLDDSAAEAAANQLLRSSSARYAVVSEFDYNSLPPLPHPINHVLQPHTPSSSTVSLASATTSVSSTTRGTYTVKVHRRRQHSRTEFPDANRDVEDDSAPRLLGLRSDPSVASLLDLYDEHGRLPSAAFSNSPPRGGGEGRAQVQRSGSTLRQLLGNPSSSVNSRGDAQEGDISWAERFLGETLSLRSSMSSTGLPTPDTDSHFPETPLQLHNDQSFITEHDFSSSMSENPAISSMEVELSSITETPPRPSHNSPYAMQDPKTPQRASQVFGFLTEKRRSRVTDDSDGRSERSLPQLPSTFSSPSDEDLPRGRSRSHFSSDSSADSIVAPLPVIPTEEQSHPHLAIESQHAENVTKKTNDVKILMAGPTKVIVTAPTPSFHHDNTSRSSGSGSGSVGSVGSEKSKRRSILAVFEKENDRHLSAKQELPRTPIRTTSISRPFQRGAVNASVYRAPASPASSSELSPAGQQLMEDLRRQRSRAREAERRRVGGYI